MVKINIAGKEYQIKLTIGFWRRVKEELGIDNRNIETKIVDDFGVVAPKVILAAIVGSDKPSVQDIEDSLDRSIMDKIEDALIEGMTKSERDLVEAVKIRQRSTLEKISRENISESTESNENKGKK